MILFEQYFQLITEGGAHSMAHPFDLPSVNTGKRLIDVFYKSVQHIKKKSSAVKLDGVNVTVKLIDKADGGKEFAIDRGSMMPLDIAGVTINDLESRFPNQLSIDPRDNETIIEKEHGLVKAGQILLSILNEAIHPAQTELKKLGLWRNKLIHINTEYSERGGSNVVEYGKNFIAFHGVNKFKHTKKKHKRTKQWIQGRDSIEVTNKFGDPGYDTKAFDSFVAKVNEISRREEFNFDTHGVIPVRFVGEPNLDDVLRSKIEIKMTPDKHETRTLGLWLQKARNPFDKSIKMGSERVKAMQKKVYQYVIGEDNVSVGPMDQMFAPDQVQLAIDGAIFWHATRLMGREILSNLQSHETTIPIGEGVVIRGLRPYTMSGGIPFKIVGDFIVGGLQSRYQNK